MNTRQFKEIKINRKQAIEQKEIIELLKTIKGTIVKKNIFTGSLKILVPKSKPNPNLSGKGCFIETPYGVISGIIHK